MPYAATVHNVFIASPSDVRPEREIARQVIYEWNAAHAESEKAVLQPIGWETHTYPEMGERPQEIINRLVIKSDILVAIFWSRLGSPTGIAASGTIEEIDKHRLSNKPIMIYFSDAPVPHNVDTKQFEEVRKLRQKYESEGLIGTFANSEDFRRVFTRDLAARMAQYLKSQPSHVYFRRGLIRAEREDWVSREDMKREFERNAAFASAISLAGSVLALRLDDPKKEVAIHNAIRALKALPEFMHVRTFGIFLARLYRQLGDLEEAVNVLHNCLAFRREKGIPVDGDDADLYYNCACYKNLKARMEGGEQQRILRQIALEDLRFSFRIFPENAKDAIQDDDLRDLPLVEPGSA